MLKFLMTRVISGLITLWFIITITFFLLRMLPGDPFQSEKAIPPKIKQNLEEKYHLDKPLLTQYFYYLGNVSKGDLGLSMKNRGRTVNSVIKKNFPVSASLGIRAILFGLIGGLLFGIISALNRGKSLDTVTMILAVIGISVPSFIIAGLLQEIAIKLNPTLFEPIFKFKLNISGWKDFSNKILPVISLGMFTLAYIARLKRTKMIEVLNQDYIKLAIAKGISKKQIVTKHAFRNSILPVITVMGPIIAAVLTGSFVIEKMFGIPGLGRYYVDSIYNRDYTMVLGITIFYAAFLIVMMIVVDVLYMLIDPRISLKKGND